jgi:hypothetical protein
MHDLLNYVLWTGKDALRFARSVAMQRQRVDCCIAARRNVHHDPAGARNLSGKKKGRIMRPEESVLPETLFD